MNLELQKVQKSLIYYGIPIISILGMFFHFLFDLVSQNVIFSLIAPVNESVWEHLKLVFFPVVIYWMISYWLLKKEYDPSINHWIKGLCAGVFSGMFLVVFAHYGILGAFGSIGTAIDIAIFVLSIALTQLVGFNVYNVSTNQQLWFYVSLFLLLLFVVAFALFTYNPPRILFFFDESTNQYGIPQ